MNICWLGTLASKDPLRVGGKAANLGRLAARHPVPPGFCLPASWAYSGQLPSSLAFELAHAYRRLGKRCGSDPASVAVRSSAVDEDGQQASFAGQHESYLNVVGATPVMEAVERCIASAHTDRALHYRRSHGLENESPVAVLVQQFIQADISAVVFSADPRTGERDHILINATWGLGESLVGGLVTPDLYSVNKADFTDILSQIGSKEWMTVPDPSGTREVPVPRAMRREPTLNISQIMALARLAQTLESQQGWPVDLECAFLKDRLYLLQCRPITTLALPTAEA